MKHSSRQYTIRNIPDHVDLILRQRARISTKSFNQVVLEALAAGAGERQAPQRDLSDIVGTMSEEDAAHIEKEVRRQRQIDWDLWK